MGGGHSAPDKPREGGGSARGKSPSVASAYYSRPQQTNDDGFLSPAETEKVVETWGIMSADIVGHGVKVFLRLAEIEPQIVQAFPFRHLKGDELLKSSLFRGHASRFMKAVEVTMENLGALEVIVIPNLIQLGRQHTKIRGFKVEYLQIFQSAMVEIWSEELGKQFKGETREGWMKIFTMITTNVLKGYEQGLAEMDQGTTDGKSGGGGGGISLSTGISPKSVELNANHHKEQTTTPGTGGADSARENNTVYSNSEGGTNHAANSAIKNSQV